jgi:4-amino-4-deoxy-L-arabinose transferase-like glycosyltransferase
MLGGADYVLVPACLIVAAVLATLALVGDSMTFDEAAHLTAGMSHLRDGEFRFLPETPPLAQIWAAWPLLLMDFAWPSPDAPGWRQGDTWTLQRVWLSQLNDGERLLAPARGMMIVLLVATCLATFFVARRLFGPAAGRLALMLAVFSPTLLAHGHLVTMDVPAALCFLLVLLTWARLLERMTWSRLLAAIAALAALSLVKFSWPLVIPALVVMAALAAFRTGPLECPLLGDLVRRRHRVLAIAAVTVIASVGTWAAIWTGYRWRYSPTPVESPSELRMPMLPGANAAQSGSHADRWDIILQGRDGRPSHGVTAGFIRWARVHRVLPEAYLYGAAWTLKISDCGSPKYLAGDVSTTGWYAYFPIAFGLKTPLPTMLLLLAGAAAIVMGRRNAGLLAGLVTFSVVYVAVAVGSRFNIGQRHLLPIYPVVFIVASAAAAWMQSRPGRWALGAAVVWLAAENLWICPQYLGYFNELGGGPAGGPRYLVDSNIDWGQDLKRLAAWAREHPREPIKLAYFGSADPTRYGFECRALPSFLDFGPPADLDAGIYVVSVTQLKGLYFSPARRDFWTPAAWAEYRSCPKQMPRYDLLRRGRLLSQLNGRRPDERIGCSLLVYRLTQDEIDALTCP